MMKFRLTPGPFLRSERTTHSIMVELSCVLAFVYLYSLIFYFARVGSYYGLRAILIGVFALLGSLVVDVIVALIKKQRTVKEIWHHISYSYSYVTALIFALTMPVGVSYYAVILGSAFATFIGKVIFGGFGYNIVNPAGIGRIFVAVSFSLAVPKIPGLVDATTGATLTSSINWITGAIGSGHSLQDLFLGLYVGTIGETYTFLLLICGIYLFVRGICDYRQGLAYLGGTFIMTLILGLLFHVANPFEYALIHLCSGGLMFGAIFMISDPVTGPTTQLGKVIYGLGAAFLTVLIRVCGNMPEGVVFSIVLMNLFTPLIESAIKGRAKEHLPRKWGIVVGMLVVATFIVYGISVIGGAL